jgi:hypothetical protein
MGYKLRRAGVKVVEIVYLSWVPDYHIIISGGDGHPYPMLQVLFFYVVALSFSLDSSLILPTTPVQLVETHSSFLMTPRGVF